LDIIANARSKIQEGGQKALIVATIAAADLTVFGVGNAKFLPRPADEDLHARSPSDR
jgi:hypothetical protein